MPKAKTLIVEDDAIIARHVLSILKKNGYDVCGHVSSGSQAVEKARQCIPDLVLMDISLEGSLDGIAAANLIHEFLDIPIVYLTAYDDAQTLQRAQITDPFGYILKPFEERTLVTNVEMALNQHRLQHALRESEERFRAIVENQGEGLAIISPQQDILFANPALGSILGVPGSELIGQSARDYVKAWYWPILMENFTNHTHGQKAFFEFEIERADGSPRSLQITATPWMKNGAYAGTFVLVMDITERKKVEQAEREQRHLAEALRDTASALAGSLNFHEVLDRILENIDKVVPHEGATIMLVEGENLRIVRRKDRKAPDAPLDTHLVISLRDYEFMRGLIENGKSIVIDDLRLNNLPNVPPGMAWIRSYAGAPIHIKGRVVGILNLGSSQRAFFTPNYTERLQTFADQAALAIENSRLYEELQQRADYLLLLNQITQTALHSVDLEQTLHQIAGLLGQLYASDGIYITLWDESRQLTIPAAAYGHTADTYLSIAHDPGERTLTASVLEATKPLVALDVTNSPHIDPVLGSTFPLRSMLGIPLIANDQKLGAILVGFRNAHAFTEAEIGRGEEIAAQVSLAITKLRLYAQVQKLAITDELTGLYNRRGIFELGREQVALAQKNGASLSLVWLDIDNFKEINDRYGHPAGDEVICVIADRCRNNVKGRDLVGRYGGEGGDELIIILVDTSLATAYEVAERLRLRIKDHVIATGKGSLHITVSLGVTTLRPEDADLTSILNRADRAMYAAKAAGRNCVFSMDTEERP